MDPSAAPGVGVGGREEGGGGELRQDEERGRGGGEMVTEDSCSV